LSQIPNLRVSGGKKGYEPSNKKGTDKETITIKALGGRRGVWWRL